MAMMKAPAHLGQDGRKLWLDLVSDFGITDAAGLVLVTTVAECLDQMRAAQLLISEHGVVLVGKTGDLRSNPASKVFSDSRAGMLSALRALNIDLEPAKAVGHPIGLPAAPKKGKGNGRAAAH